MRAIVKITGIDELISDLKKMDKQCRRVSKKSAKKVVDTMRDAIRAAAPVETGALKKAIKSNIKTYENDKVVSAAVVIDAPGAHWIPVEFGHSKGIDGNPVPPKPFVYPTRDRLLPGLLDEMENDIDSAIVATGGQ